MLNNGLVNKYGPYKAALIITKDTFIIGARFQSFIYVTECVVRLPSSTHCTSSPSQHHLLPPKTE